MHFIGFFSFIILLAISSPVFAQVDSTEEQRAKIQEIRKERKMEQQILSGDTNNRYKQAQRQKIDATSNDKNLLSKNRTKRQTLQNMTNEERKTYMHERRSKWNTLTEQEKEAKRNNMIDRWSQLPPEVRERRKEKFKNMSIERKQAFQERHPRIYEDLIAE